MSIIPLREAGDAAAQTGPLRLPVHAADSSDDPSDILLMLTLRGFIEGAQPWAGIVRLERVRADAPLLPPGVEPRRAAEELWGSTHLAAGDGWTLHVIRWKDRAAKLTVTATTEELGREILARATHDAVDLPPDDRLTVTMGFWHGARKATRRTRSIEVVDWPEIRRNYAAPVATALDQLTRVTPTDVTGRLLLLHGPPGTGKTTALRALAHAWRDWCQVDYVLDPERLLDDPGYLMSVALGADHDDDDDATERWRLVVLEDCDELVRADAKAGAGQALSRLLNLTDGLLGQGLHILVGLTTNEALARLHPAVVRPGRCLAEIHIGPLPRAEAAAWLGTDSGVPSGGATIAELYRLHGELRKVERPEPATSTGMYV